MQIPAEIPKARPSPRLGLPLLLILFSTAEYPAVACDTPVYIYAVQNWSADAYDAVIFRRGPLPADARKAVGILEKAAEGAANIVLHDVDLASGTKTKALTDLYQRAGRPALPALAVLFPPRTVRKRLFWTGPLTVENVRRVLQSPARSRVFELLNEQKASAVWVFVPGRNSAESRRAEQRLRTLLSRMEKEGKDLLPDENMPLHFEIVTVNPSDPAEAFFVTLLRHTEPDLEQYEDKPMVFPVFGRGRALFSLVGDGINKDTIGQTCGFLLGPCSCEIKSMNPGVDLLLTGVWKDETYGETPLVETVDLRSVSSVIEPVAAAAESSQDTENTETTAAAPPASGTSPKTETAQPQPPPPGASPVPSQTAAESQTAADDVRISPLTREERVGRNPEAARTRTAVIAAVTAAALILLGVIGGGTLLLLKMHRPR